MTEDGGVAESLNVQLDSSEISPMHAPEDVTETLGVPEDVQADYFYIHKTNVYEHYITFDEQTKEVSAYIDKKKYRLLNIEQASFVTFGSMGNTLLVNTTSGVNYFIFKEGAYMYLGTKIPFPTFQFTPKYYTENSFSESETQYYFVGENSSGGSPSDNYLPAGLYSKKTWNEYNEAIENDPTEDSKTGPVNKKAKEMAKKILNDAKAEKVFIKQVFIRYAVTLFDDSILSSVPYLMVGGYESPFLVRYTKEYSKHYRTIGESVETDLYSVSHLERLTCKACYPYRIEAKLMNDPEEFAQWSDLIKSIDFYISEEVELDLTTLQATTCFKEGTGEYAPSYSHTMSDPIVSQELTYYEHWVEANTGLLLHIGGPAYQKNYENRLLNNSIFYKIESINYDPQDEGGYGDSTRRIEELRKGSLIKTDRYFDDYDGLIAEGKTLVYDDMLHSQMLWSKGETFNNSIIAHDITEYIGSGSTVIPCPAVEIEQMQKNAEGTDDLSIFGAANPKIFPDNYDDSRPLIFCFHIEEDGKTYTVYGKTHKGEETFYNKDLAFYGWLAFPHRGCTRVTVATPKEDEGYYCVEIKMKPHPLLACSYGYIGVDKNISTYLVEKGVIGTEDDLPVEDNRINRANKLYVTSIDNPFYFSEKNQYTFSSNIVGVAIATMTLSQGQFGQFPLAVFTKEGVWMMQANEEGLFKSAKPKFRDVCVNGDSITPIENAIIFVTSQGVMIMQNASSIQEAQVACISPNMNGRHYQIENSARTIIENQDFFCDLLPALSDNTHFLAFVKEATVAYDYAGRRLIFIKKDEKYQYIYKLDTQTWHKGAYDVDLVAPINSYPECLVQGDKFEIETKIFWKLVSNESQEPYNVLAEKIQAILPELREEAIDTFLEDGAAINVTDVSEEVREELYAVMDESHVITKFEERVEEKHYTRIYDLSTILDAAESKTPVRGVIATRQFDLGEPDVFKTITDVRIRGQFPKGAVKFILLGSNDGINFATVSTLRGRSWKLFRMIILADLTPTERISWIDIMYDTRFTNKLR